MVAQCSFFFSSRRRHTRSDRDWSSDVCSSDLGWPGGRPPAARRGAGVAAPPDRPRRPGARACVYSREPLPLWGEPPGALGERSVFFGRPLVHFGRGSVFLGRPLVYFGRGSVFFGRPLVHFG